MQIRVFACDGCGKKTDSWPATQGWYVLEKQVNHKTQQWHICSDECMVKVALSICDDSAKLPPLCKSMIDTAFMFGGLFVSGDQKENGASDTQTEVTSESVSASQP